MALLEFTGGFAGHDVRIGRSSGAEPGAGGPAQALVRRLTFSGGLAGHEVVLRARADAVLGAGGTPQGPVRALTFSGGLSGFNPLIGALAGVADGAVGAHQPWVRKLTFSGGLSGFEPAVGELAGVGSGAPGPKRALHRPLTFSGGFGGFNPAVGGRAEALAGERGNPLPLHARLVWSGSFGGFDPAMRRLLVRVADPERLQPPGGELRYRFMVEADAGIVAYEWDFGDGATSTDAEAVHDFAGPGTYTVVLLATDEAGNRIRAERVVVVENLAPTADFTLAPAAPKTTDKVQFTDQSTDPDGIVVAWHWRFGDGATSTERHPVHRFRGGGEWLVALTVTDDHGVRHTTERLLSVAEVGPQAAFDHDPEASTAAPVQFTDQSTDADGIVVAWQWDFGDGGTSTERHPRHRYAAQGDYDIQLTVTDDSGLTHAAQRRIMVVGQHPTAAFALAPAAPTTADVVQFTDQSSDPDGEIVAWQWDFGDGEIAADANPEHQYADDGAYEVFLTVTDNDGATHTTRRLLRVANVAPLAAFTPEPGTPQTNEAVEFLEAASDSDGRIIAWLWDFGDGATSTLRNPRHSYDDDGTYRVKLKVIDDDGAAHVAVAELAVLNRPPTAAFDVEPDEPHFLEDVQFTDTSEDSDGEIVSWHWDFGDGTGSTDQNPKHRYDEPGTYRVQLTVTDDDGAQATMARDLEVGLPLPVPLFSWTEALTDGGIIVQVPDESWARLPDDETGRLGLGIRQWHWEFIDPAGERNASAEQNPTRIISAPGQHSVELTVTDERGRQATLRKVLRLGSVEPLPEDSPAIIDAAIRPISKA